MVGVVFCLVEAAFAHGTFCVLGTFGRILVALFGVCGAREPKVKGRRTTLGNLVRKSEEVFGPRVPVNLALRAFLMAFLTVNLGWESTVSDL